MTTRRQRLDALYEFLRDGIVPLDVAAVVVDLSERKTLNLIRGDARLIVRTLVGPTLRICRVGRTEHFKRPEKGT